MTIVTVEIDLARNVFAVHGVDTTGIKNLHNHADLPFSFARLRLAKQSACKQAAA